MIKTTSELKQKTPSSKEVILKENSYIFYLNLGKKVILAQKRLMLKEQMFPLQIQTLFLQVLFFYFFMPLFFWCGSSYRSVVQYNYLIIFYCDLLTCRSSCSPGPKSPKNPGKQKTYKKTIHPGYSYSPCRTCFSFFCFGCFFLRF